MAADRITDLLKAQSGAAPTGAATPPEPPPGPTASPMSTPEPKMGNKEGALVTLSQALDLIEQSIPALGSETPEGQKAVMAMKALSGILGARKARTDELQPAEIMQLLGSLPQAGNVTPEVSAALGPRPGQTPPPPPGGGATPPPSPPPM